MTDQQFMKQAIELARDNVAKGGEPFGAVLVRNGEVVATGVNETYKEHDSTAHAEIQALRNASKQHGQVRHFDTVMYASGIPCAMCMAAMIQAGVSKVIYCAGDDMGEAYGWSTEHLYKRMQGELGDQGIEVVHMPDPEKLSVFDAYKEKFGLGSNEHMKVD